MRQYVVVLRMYEEQGRRTAVTLLRAAGFAQAAEEGLDPAGLARRLDSSVAAVEFALEQLEAAGLLLVGDAHGQPPLLRRAGRQFLARDGHVAPEVLAFLPDTADDLDTRAALLAAGSVLVDGFRTAILEGRGVEHAAELVPPAFAAAVDARMALDLYAAAVALMARLSAGEPAGCVAEEVVAVALIQQARAGLELAAEVGELPDEDADAAIDELRSLFALFQDDDVLDLFDMEEPADAALAGHDPINRQLGVADQRLEAWFRPFGWTAPTGYLAVDRLDGDAPPPGR